jgi:hypothetical protein
VPFVIERRTEDDLPTHIRGAARWNEVNDDEGYFVFDPLTGTYRAVEYSEDTRQWYFINQDTRTRNWVATQPVPSSLALGRESIRHSTTQAAEVDDSQAGHTQSPLSQDRQHHRSAMTTQTTTSTAAAALTLAGTTAPTTQPIFRGFGSQPSGSKGKTGVNPPDGGGGGSSGPPGGGGPFGPPGGGGGHPAGGPGAGGGGGGGGAKLGGNPPPEFNGDRSYANTFMNKFNLYRLANMEAEQMAIPMKRAALLLGFIKGPNVDDWVRLRTDEMLARYNRGIDQNNPIYWDDLGQKFMDAFWDTASRERAEEKLQVLTWTPGDVDTFVAQFRSLADQAEYRLDDRPTISLFASKLPFKMMQHIMMVVKPRDFQGWADAARQYHQDNTAVNTIRGFNEEVPQKKFGNRNKTGFSAKQWAQILGVKMPTPDPNAMDTRADRSRSYFKNKKGSKGRASTTKEDPEVQRKEGRCFTCNKQGHLARNCPDKPTKKEDKGKVKARTAETEDSDNESFTEASDKELDPEAYIRLGKSLKEEDKITIVKMAIKAEQGAEGEDMDF